MRFVMTVVFSAVLLSSVAGCPSPTQKSLRRAQKALEECDLREAHGHFDEAYSLSGDDLDAALGFALTDVLFLAEDPNVTRALKALGAERAIDVEALLYGEGAVLERLADHDDCDSLDAFVERNVPYAPFFEDLDPLSLIDEDLTIEDVLTDLKKIDGRLAREAKAFESAAENLEEPYVFALEGSCGAGLGEVEIGAPELYGAAAVLEALRAAIQIADGYDWDIPIHDIASEDMGVVLDTCNAHVGHLTDPGAIGEAGETLVRALDLADRGLAAASAQGASPNALFAWSKFDETIVGDLRELGDAARTSIEDETIVAVPFWTPELGADLGLVFADPPDAGALDKPLFRLETGYYGDPYLEVNTERLEGLFVGYFDRDIFQSNDDEYMDVDWEQDMALVFNPGGRFDGYYCE